MRESISDRDIYPSQQINTGFSSIRPKYNLMSRKLKPNAEKFALIVGDVVQKSVSAKDPQNKKEKVVELYLETFAENFQEAYEFIVRIAEPNSRQEFMHSYQIKATSLFAAITYGFTGEHILNEMQRLNKFTDIGPQVKGFVVETAAMFGKCRLVLQTGKYFLESEDPEVLAYYKDMVALMNCWEGEITLFKEDNETASTNFEGARESLINIKDNGELYKKLEEMVKVAEREVKRVDTYRLAIKPDSIEKVRIMRQEADESRYKYMISQEYDYVMDNSTPLAIALKPSTRIRNYQEAALNRIFVKDRARSGIVVLPCGAGKTLVGISAICHMRKYSLIVTNSNLMVDQWCDQIKNFAEIDSNRVVKFVSADSKDKIPDISNPCIVVSTYSMISNENRSTRAETYMEQIRKIEWGLLILDEVQIAPADTFKKTFLTKTVSHCKLGLTATLIREDNKIQDLQFYIGPKLYEESWIELTKQGHLANVQCFEIRVEMSPAFRAEYINQTQVERNHEMSVLLYTANPNKCKVLQDLIDYHLEKQHKILVFIESVAIVQELAKRMRYPYIIGNMNPEEKQNILRFFKTLPDWNVLFTSKIGDVGIDIPDANVAIQVSSHYGARRQEAQRLGRVIRPKERKEGELYQSYFYTLVSLGTEDSKYALKRQKFLIKQGYKIQVLYENELNFGSSSKKQKASVLPKEKDWLFQILTVKNLAEETNPRPSKKVNVKKNINEGDAIYMEN